MLEFLSNNIDAVAAVVGALIIVAGAVVGIDARKRMGLLDSVLFGLVTWAEREYGGGTGSLKLAAVIERLYPLLPAVVRLFISVEWIEGIIDKALAAAKLRWERNVKLIKPNIGI